MSSPAATLAAPAPFAAPAPAVAAPSRGRAVLNGLLPLLVDVGVPLASYYVLRAAGLGLFAALAWSSALPAVRTVWGVLRERRLNGLAALIVTVNAVSLVTSLLTGDPRLMLAKDSGVSSLIGLVVLVTALKGQPMMTAGVRPWLVKGNPARDAAWQRLAGGSAAASAAFRRAENRFSVVWGAALLGECVVRVVGAYTLPVETMVWLGTVVMVVTMVGAFLVSGRLGAVPMEHMITEEDAAFGAGR
ncbi:VC0807 family protein [Streptomyces sp. NPDC057499]|uniref:VC0807 family protein n=1 Tax=Streptomyces sp. NPDC057499 TaxID=3346150 RepID=UPI0036B03CA0